MIIFEGKSFNIGVNKILELPQHIGSPHSQLLIREQIRRVSKLEIVAIIDLIEKKTLEEKRDNIPCKVIELVANCILLLDTIRNEIGRVRVLRLILFKN